MLKLTCKNLQSCSFGGRATTGMSNSMLMHVVYLGLDLWNIELLLGRKLHWQKLHAHVGTFSPGVEIQAVLHGLI